MPKITIQKNNDGQNNNWGFTVTVTDLEPPYEIAVNAPGTGPDEIISVLPGDSATRTFSRIFQPPQTVTVWLRKNGVDLDTCSTFCD